MSSDKPHSYWGILFILLFSVLTGFIILIMPNVLENKKAEILKVISYMKSEYRFADLEITAKTVKNVTFTLTLYNIDGEKTASKNFTLSGYDIFLESKVVVVKAEDQERAFIFPLKLYTDSIPQEEGKDLLSLYVENNYPKIYIPANRDPDFISVIKRIFQTSLSDNDNIKKLEGESIKIIINMDAVLHQSDFNKFQEGKTYNCILHPNGGLELQEVK